MVITRVRLEHFRNFNSLDLQMDPGTNLFFGDNAQGKTNILESMFLCGTTKSHRGAKDRDLVMFGQDEAHIRMDVIRKDMPVRIDMHLKKNKAKGIAVNLVPVRRSTELMGICSFIFFSPEDLGLVKNGPSVRRRFMDMEMSQLDRLYVANLGNYYKALAQRNRLLKDISFRGDLIGTLDVWDDQLCLYGEKIIEARSRFVEKLCVKAREVHLNLTGGAEQMSICYEKNTPAMDMKDKVRQGRERDLRAGTTLTGPHRDDLGIRVNGVDIRVFGSQGQQRTGALSLKLAEIELVREIMEEPPVLMLDDVLSELDENRQRYLLESIRNVQTMITCTGREHFDQYGFRIDRLFKVVGGQVLCD